MEGSTLPREAEGLFRNRELRNIEGIKTGCSLLTKLQLMNLGKQNLFFFLTPLSSMSTWIIIGNNYLFL